MEPEISVIIPTTGLKPNVDLLNRELEGVEHEIIIQYDLNKVGKGWALQEGFKKSKGGRIVWLDADFQIHPKHIKKYLKLNADVVVASKLNPLSHVKCSTLRRLISVLSALITKILFNLPLRDAQTGLKIFQRKVLESPFRVLGFGHDIEVLTHAYHKGYTIVEMPVEITETVNSTVSWRSCFRTLYEMLWLRWHLR